ncbi:PEGA domain-containing protein [Candidatus Micrarchaeota archaeon]|nr:PEGA domain-containing protein [Candidatus Micrarchaeota archaeon]
MAEKVVFVTGMFFLLFLIISKANSPTGFAEISSLPEGARVIIDDVPRGFTPASGSLEVSLSPGKHTIVITKDGYTGYVDAFRVDRGETKEIKVELEKLN